MREIRKIWTALKIRNNWMHTSARQHLVQTLSQSSKMRPWRCQIQLGRELCKIRASLNTHHKKRHCLKRRKALMDKTRANGRLGSSNRFSYQSKWLVSTLTKYRQLLTCHTWWTHPSISERKRYSWKMLSKWTSCLVPYSSRPRETLRRSSCWGTECRRPICNRLRQILPNF